MFDSIGTCILILGVVGVVIYFAVQFDGANIRYYRMYRKSNGWLITGAILMIVSLGALLIAGFYNFGALFGKILGLAAVLAIVVEAFRELIKFNREEQDRLDKDG